jgi:hypothetical protein
MARFRQMTSKIWCLVGVLLLSVTCVTPAGAQQPGYSNWHRGWLRPGNRLGGGAGFRGQFGGRPQNWRDNRGWQSTTYGGINPAALAQFDSRANQLRGEIGARLSARAISPGQAYRMNQELNSLMSLRSQLAASGGAGGASQMGDINRRLVQLQMALRSPIAF